MGWRSERAQGTAAIAAKAAKAVAPHVVQQTQQLQQAPAAIQLLDAHREPRVGWRWLGDFWWEDLENGHLHWCGES